MSDIKDLYQEVILDHGRSPRNFREMEQPAGAAEGYNPLCGDRVHLYVGFQEDKISDVSFKGSGCAISTASASIMTEAVKGKTVAEARTLFENFIDLVTGRQAVSGGAGMGKLAVFSGVAEFPIRVKCATLAWHTLLAALNGSGEKISTE